MARCRKAAGRECRARRRGLNWSIDTVRSGLGRRYAVISSARDSWIPMRAARKLGLEASNSRFACVPCQCLLRQAPVAIHATSLAAASSGALCVFQGQVPFCNQDPMRGETRSMPTTKTVSHLHLAG